MLHCTVNTAMLTTNVTLSCCCRGATANISISSACLCRCATDTSNALLLALHNTGIITQVMTECQSWSGVLSGHVEHGDGTLSTFACDRESLSLSHSVTTLHWLRLRIKSGNHLLNSLDRGVQYDHEHAVSSAVQRQGSQSLYKAWILMNTACARNTWAAANHRAQFLLKHHFPPKMAWSFLLLDHSFLVFSVWQTVDNL